MPQGLINQLIAQHLALREHLGQTPKVPVIQVERSPDAKHSVEVRETPYRRLPETQDAAITARAMTYAEKRRRWKEEMKRKLKKQKIPPRQITRPIITGEKSKYYVTYSPYYRLYQVSRNAPRGWDQGESEVVPTGPVPLATTTPPPPTTTTSKLFPTSMPTTTPPASTTTTTTSPAPASTTPKVISLQVKPVDAHRNSKMQIRVAAVKPTPEAKAKQLLYMDDGDDEMEKVEEEDYYVDENGQTIEGAKSTTTELPESSTPKPDDGMTPIVFPMGSNQAENVKTEAAPQPSVSDVVTTRKPMENRGKNLN